MGLLRLGRPGDALLLGPAGAALAFLLTEGAEDVLLVDLVVAPWLVLERLVAVDVVLESALERELGRLTEHLDEELFVEVLVLGVRVRLLVDDVAILLRSRALRLRRSLFRLLRLALDLLELLELGHDLLGSLVLLDVSHVVHGARLLAPVVEVDVLGRRAARATPGGFSLGHVRAKSERRRESRAVDLDRSWT